MTDSTPQSLNYWIDLYQMGEKDASLIALELIDLTELEQQLQDFSESEEHLIDWAIHGLGVSHPLAQFILRKTMHLSSSWKLMVSIQQVPTFISGSYSPSLRKSSVLNPSAGIEPKIAFHNEDDDAIRILRRSGISDSTVPFIAKLRRGSLDSYDGHLDLVQIKKDLNAASAEAITLSVELSRFARHGKARVGITAGLTLLLLANGCAIAPMNKTEISQITLADGRQCYEIYQEGRPTSIHCDLNSVAVNIREAE